MNPQPVSGLGQLGASNAAGQAIKSLANRMDVNPKEMVGFMCLAGGALLGMTLFSKSPLLGAAGGAVAGGVTALFLVGFD